VARNISQVQQGKQMRVERCLLVGRAGSIVRKGASAFTLPESLVAMGVGAVMLTALYASFAYGYSTVKMCRQELRATQVMVEQTEKIRLIPWANLRSFATNVYADPTDQASGGGGTLYTLTFNTNKPVMSGLNYQTNTMKLVTVSVTWTNGNVIRTNFMQTYFASNGLQTFVYGQK
jgi:prepilin-type N-terminal cleavage/methylation domain-containing protein